LALTGANVAGRAARKVKRAFAGSGEEERSAEEQPEGPPLPSHKTVPLDTINDLVDQPPGSKAVPLNTIIDLDGRAIADKVRRLDPI